MADLTAMQEGLAHRGSKQVIRLSGYTGVS